VDSTSTTHEYGDLSALDKLKPNEQELLKIKDTLDDILRDFQYMQSREIEMRDLNEATNERVRNFRFITLMAFLAVGAWQIWYLRSFFQAKKLI
jgi:hypothetical protein